MRYRKGSLTKLPKCVNIWPTKWGIHMNKNMEQFNLKLNYLGYKGINIDRVSLNSFSNFIKIMPTIDKTALISLTNLPDLSLDEVRELTKVFCEKYFSLHDISYVGIDKLQKNMGFIGASNNSREIYDRVNSTLTMINPLDIDIKLIDGHSMVGQTIKPIIIVPSSTNDENRKVYFSNIELGKQLTKLSVGTMVHEIAHLEQEQHIGYAEDFLNKEIISIFLEKVVALEMDPTGELLKISEKMRFNDVLKHYYILHLNKGQLSKESHVEDLLYIKSTFYAEKLFDMYLNERKQKNKDKYFYEIQDVFDGKITVEDLIRGRNISTTKALDLSLLKRHI